MSMTRGDIEAAMSEAGRFMDRASEALEQIDRDQGAFAEHDAGEWNGPLPTDASYGSAETGALRRSSLDLTRALAEMRKS